MNEFFRKLPLPSKLLLIGLVPMIFLVYVSIQLYKEKSNKIILHKDFVERVEQSGNISALIIELQKERKLSFDFAIKKDSTLDLTPQRALTDAALKKIEGQQTLVLKDLRSYTFLDNLQNIRNRVSSGVVNPNDVVHNYTTMIYRLNTLNVISPSSETYLRSVYTELVSQKLLHEMLTNLRIIQSNIFTVLYTRKYMVETLIGTLGVYQVYRTYEKEFLVKSSPETVAEYNRLKSGTELKTSLQYIDTLFSKFSFDSSYTADSWWAISDKGLLTLRHLQQSLWNGATSGMNEIVEREEASRNRTLVLLIISLLIALAIVFYIIRIITQLLSELKHATQTISKGATGVKINIHSKDAIGSLAESVLRIDETNKQLAETASAIGRGNFNAPVKPRGDDDMLGHAIMQMRFELQSFRRKLEQKVDERTKDLNEANLELERSNKDLEQFAYIASHDLQEPVRKIGIFSQYIRNNAYEKMDDSSRTYLDKIVTSTERMRNIIKDLLDFSHIDKMKDEFEEVDLNKIIEDVRSDLELVILQKGAVINVDQLPIIEGIPVQVNQLFYNLINNGLKFTEEGRSPIVNITSREIGTEEIPSHLDRSKKYYEIKVKDNGIGFNPDHAEKIFNMFQRLSKSYTGTGIGLAICKKIAESHRGHIKASSELGQGATFTIILPQKHS